MPGTVAIRHREGQDKVARRFFVLALAVFALGAGLAALLIQLLPVRPSVGEVVFYPAFIVSTFLLAGGSLSLHAAVTQVRRERQGKFRMGLLLAVAAGIAFIAVQTYGVRCMLRNQVPGAMPEDVNSFVIVGIALHGMHFAVAMLFLLYVTTLALGDRYDHEYYWGVVVCEYFWHALGGVWLAIAGVFLLVS